MPDFSSLFVTREGEPIHVGDQTITVVSRALRAMPPFGFGGLVWNRPVAVKVETGGVEHILPVVDQTRRQQIFILAFGMAIALLVAMLFSPRRPKSKASR
jgi:hypothetical protein